MGANEIFTDRRLFVRKLTFGSLSLLVLPNQLSAWDGNIRDRLQKDRGLIFLFQGDSITHGGRGMNPTDLNHVMGHGFAATVCARMAEAFPERGLKFFNRGLIGHKVTDLADRWEIDTLALKPDVLTVLVGINDSDSLRADAVNGVSVERYAEVYRDLLTKVRLQNPNVLLVLGEPFTLPYDTSNVRFADVRLRQEIVRQLALEFKAIFLPFQSVFNKALLRAPEKYWIWDNIHPTIAGHELMAREWIAQVSKRIGFLKKILK